MGDGMSGPAARRDGGAAGPAPSAHAMRVPLVDAHAHTLYRGPVDARLFTQAMFLADLPGSGGDAARDERRLERLLDGWLGCALVRLARAYGDDADSGTSSPADARAYWRTRGGRGYEDRLLRACGVRTWVLDTGAAADVMETPRGFLARAAGSRAARVVRLETVAERVLQAGDDATFPGRFRDALRTESAAGDDGVPVVGFKSVAAYRTGFAIDWSRPDDAHVAEAVARLDASGRARLADPTVEAFTVHEALRYGLPVQFHVGFGDAEARVHDVDPTLLEPLVRTGTPIHLLHCAPYERQAAWMCATHPNVVMDLSLAVMHAGVQGARALLERALQWCPFGQLLYASDGFGVAETHALGALIWRRAVGALADDWTAQGVWDAAQASRVIDALAHGNAERLYRLACPQPRG
ncbi:amidohydrolase family protein [Bifidobacterium sp. CP2]|uniref:amidohydrolase family protein n=1 Tax=Bifidobacterium sp. CP2 TaxID=2809025 RepID=UPI001BDC6816|nr:amidohydrolase family protein [Bifidobacterium sp. CP2]MBT1181381.1 amidohydrolase family protein [Bifidobacterium sp. CP2]